MGPRREGNGRRPPPLAHLPPRPRRAFPGAAASACPAGASHRGSPRHGRTQPPPPRLAQPGRALPALPSFPLLPLSVSPAAAPPPPALPASASRESLAPPTAARSTSGARRAGRLAPTPPSPPTRRPLPAGTRRYATAEKGAGAPAAEHVTAGRGGARRSRASPPPSARTGCGSRGVVAPPRGALRRGREGSPRCSPALWRSGRGVGWVGPARQRSAKPASAGAGGDRGAGVLLLRPGGRNHRSERPQGHQVHLLAQHC